MPDQQVAQSETLEQIASDIMRPAIGKVAPAIYCEMEIAIIEALRNERERALRDAARLECVFCTGADGFNPLPVGVEAGNYVHRNEPPNGQAGVYCKASRINDLIFAIREGR